MRTTFRRAVRVVPLFALALFVGGCGSGSHTQTTSATDRESAGGPKSTVSVSDVTAYVLSLTLDKYKGKVVVVDFWATWCAPCVKKFPHLVELHRKYADKGLVCVSVSMDKWEKTDEEYAKEHGREKILAFLTEKGATFPNFIAGDPNGELSKFEAKFGPFPSIPHMTIFDKAGRKVWDSESGKPMTDDQLDKFVAAELGE